MWGFIHVAPPPPTLTQYLTYSIGVRHHSRHWEIQKVTKYGSCLCRLTVYQGGQMCPQVITVLGSGAHESSGGTISERLPVNNWGSPGLYLDRLTRRGQYLCHYSQLKG